MDRTIETVLLLILCGIFIHFSYLVWFKYSIYQLWLRKIHSFAHKQGLPFLAFSHSLTNTSNYKWFVRFVALIMLLIFSFSLFAILYDLNN